jgi:hypothetical protein
MKFLLWVATLFTLVSATALTYKLEAKEKSCFFTTVIHPGSKVAFYFAVCPKIEALKILI